MKKTICFSCLNPYHLFMSYILSKTVYKNDYKILILSDYHKMLQKAYKNILNKFKIWDKVILIQEKSFANRTKQLKSINFKNIDVLHFFAFAFHSCLLLDYIKKRTKIILTDEGVMTYVIKESLKNSRLKSTNIDSVSEIWVLDKDLYVSDFKRKVKSIKMKKYLCNDQLVLETCKELNEIFDYKHKEINADIIFFDQPLTKVHLTIAKEEKSILAKIFNELSGYRTIIKKHPFDIYDKYRAFNVSLIKDDGIPWQLILLNEYITNRSNLNNKIFISYYSATLISTKIFLNIFKIPCKLIFLYEFLDNCIKIPSNPKVFKDFIENFKKIYGENVYTIKSIDELHEIL